MEAMAHRNRWLSQRTKAPFILGIFHGYVSHTRMVCFFGNPCIGWGLRGNYSVGFFHHNSTPSYLRTSRKHAKSNVGGGILPSLIHFRDGRWPFFVDPIKTSILYQTHPDPYHYPIIISLLSPLDQIKPYSTSIKAPLSHHFLIIILCYDLPS